MLKLPGEAADDHDINDRFILLTLLVWYSRLARLAMCQQLSPVRSKPWPANSFYKTAYLMKLVLSHGCLGVYESSPVLKLGQQMNCLLQTAVLYLQEANKGWRMQHCLVTR